MTMVSAPESPPTQIDKDDALRIARAITRSLALMRRD